MTRAAYRDFPVDPLLPVVARMYAAAVNEKVKFRTDDPRIGGGVSAVRRTFRISGDRAARWMRDGLTVWEADRAACTVGEHPATLWPGLWHDIALIDDVAARDRDRNERWVRAYVTRHRLSPCTPRRTPTFSTHH